MRSTCENGEKLITLREAWEQAGCRFRPGQSVTQREPCGNPNLFFPTVTVPRHLMDPEKADEAEAAIKECDRITGGLATKVSRFDTSEFQRAADRFSRATGGVGARQVLEVSRDRFFQR